jgi:Ser/Thr protein kinase RdoA (MazF antagonist)
MERRIKDRFNDEILHESMGRFGICQDQIRWLDGMESFIFEFTIDDRDYILRISHSLRRSIELIQGEVDWIKYLSDGGASVAKAVLSKNGSLVEAVEDGKGGSFLATAFQKAAGMPPWEEHWNESMFRDYGRLIGRIHALSKNYSPPHPSWRRPEWDDPGMIFVDQWVPDSETVVHQRFEDLMVHLTSLPKDRHNYGLIHQDAHAGNLVVDEEGCLTLFDFDDCAYSWYMNDIAIILFYAVIGEEDPATFTRTFMTHFLHGYTQENDLDLNWLREIPYFLKLREIDLYAVIHRSYDVHELEDPWVANYMNNRKFKIEANVPFIDFDFETLIPHLAN